MSIFAQIQKDIEEEKLQFESTRETTARETLRSSGYKAQINSRVELIKRYLE